MDGTHDIYVGQVGFWLPWDPEPFDVQDQEYLEKDLNTLMKSKKENEIKKNLHFEEEKRKKMEYNMKKGKGYVNDFEKSIKSDIADLDKKKYLVPNDITVGQFVYILRKRIKLTPEKAIFIFLGNNTIPPTSALLSKLYEKHNDDDGFLYLTYAGENTFGK